MRRAILVAWLIAVATPASRPNVLAGQSNDTAAYRPGKDSVLEARTSAVAAQLRCPVCQGLSLQDSPSELAQSMRAVVRDQLAQGKSPEEVKAYFVSKYGEWILLAPKASGFNLIAYAAPILIVLAGVVGIFVAVRRWTSNPPVIPESPE